MTKSISVLFAMWLMLPLAASALPLPTPDMKMPSALALQDTGIYDFEGIVSLSNCSGSFVRLETAKDTDRALVLTNGHCLENGMPQAGEFVVNQTSRRRFGLMNSSAQRVGSLRATKLIYATMTKSDIALYELEETYEQILTKHKIRPFMLASKRPEIAQEIQIISGYWQRGFSCSIEAFAWKLREDDWSMEDSIRYSRPGCEVIGGTSGSPVIAKETREVIAVNNTINENGGRCTMNNPCEVNEKGVITAVQGYGYAQQTYVFYSCLNERNELDLNREGCLLHH